MNKMISLLLFISLFISQTNGQTCEDEALTLLSLCEALTSAQVPNSECGCTCETITVGGDECVIIPPNNMDNRCVDQTCVPTSIPTSMPTRPPTQTPTQTPTQIPTQTPTQPTTIPTQIPTQPTTNPLTQIPTQITPAPIVSISISTTGITTGITPSGEPCDCCSGSSSSDSSDSSDGSDSSDSSSNPCSSQCICVSSSESDSESEEIMSLGAFAELNNKGNDMINDNNEGTGNKDIVLNVTDYTFYNLWALCGVVIFINVFILYICWSRNKRNKREKIKYIDNDQARIDIMA